MKRFRAEFRQVPHDPYLISKYFYANNRQEAYVKCKAWIGDFVEFSIIDDEKQNETKVGVST